MNSSKDRMWLIEKVLLGEGTDETQLTSSEKTKLLELQQDNAAILSQYPKEDMAKQIWRRFKEQNRESDEVNGENKMLSQASQRTKLFSFERLGYGLRWWGSGLAVACSLALYLSVGNINQEIHGSHNTVRLKGAALTLHKKSGNRVQTLRDGDAVHEGDRIQIGYSLDRPAFGTIISIDGRDVVTVHWPADEQNVSSLEIGRGQLPFSYLLDDAPLFERFFLVLSPDAFAVEDIVRAAEVLAKEGKSADEQLGLAQKFEQIDLTLRKASGKDNNGS